MDLRIKKEVIRDVVIDHTMFESKKVTKEKLLKTLNSNEISDTDEIIGIVERSGFYKPFGAMDDEQSWYQHFVLIIRNYREETDEEYFQRMKEQDEKERQVNERERLQYLRLKAKFENDKTS